MALIPPDSRRGRPRPQPCRASRLILLVAVLLPVISCGTLSPFRHKLEVGKDTYAVFAADAPDGRGELYAVAGRGGEVLQITFTRAVELAPALSPDGSEVAFLRSGEPDDSSYRSVWILNLLNGAERELELPNTAGRPNAVEWAPGGEALYVRTDRATYRAAAPPSHADARPVPGKERASADSSFAVLLGQPAFARAEPCADLRDLCVVGGSGTSSLLVEGGRDPVRWGVDSVGYFMGDQLVVRPLGPGRGRALEWHPTPQHPRDITFFRGER